MKLHMVPGIMDKSDNFLVDMQDEQDTNGGTVQAGDDRLLG